MTLLELMVYSKSQLIPELQRSHQLPWSQGLNSFLFWIFLSDYVYNTGAVVIVFRAMFF